MILYQNSAGNLSEIKEHPFKLEKEIQTIFERNLKTIMRLQLVKGELTIKNKRIDSLGFDLESKSFTIIEYKRDKNHSVVDQGVSYLNLMLEYKADFIIEYNESLQQNLKRDDVDWSQSKVAFVSTSFTENQKQATNFRDLAIELWEVKRYENGTIAIDSIKKSVAAPSIKQLAPKNEILQQVAKEIKIYTEQDHLENKTEFIKELYEKFKNSILNLGDDIIIQPKKDYIAFKKNTNITDITVLKKSLKIWINLKKGTLDDPKKIARDVSEIGHWGNGDYELLANDDMALEYIMSLIKQAIA
jgi:predicted transport protein